MKHSRIISVLTLVIIFFTSCRTGKSMQSEIRAIRSDLYYELTTPEYLEEIIDTIYLNFIDYSNIDYYTTVKRAGTIIVPLFIFNYSWEKFNVTLGESSLTQTYREFLTEALLAESNSSACFNLRDNAANTAPDSAYMLNVKILHNRTSSAIELNNALIFMCLGDYSSFIFNFENYTVMPTVTNLRINVRLTKGKDCLLEKSYFVHHKPDYAGGKSKDSFFANEICINRMTESLSVATKKIVEHITEELHGLMLQNLIHRPFHKSPLTNLLEIIAPEKKRKMAYI
ncbi:hypothetical protein EZS27_003474 [termite gut metagenome]|uniref:Lipoprotein n=1 Tax=termite gut metagenome TaxID=433724 RepID=A0A5J4ST09_9ZZZZ